MNTVVVVLILLALSAVAIMSAAPGGRFRQNRRYRLLSRFAEQLDHPKLELPRTLHGTRVEGTLAGQRVVLTLTHPDKEDLIEYEVLAPHAGLDLEVRRAGTLRRMVRRLVHEEQPEHEYVLRGDTAQGADLVQQEAVRHALEGVFSLGFGRVLLGEDRVSVSGELDPVELGSARLKQVFRALAAVARLVERQPAAHESSLPSFSWTAGRGVPRCPYCRDEAAPGASALTRCDACGTLHHTECFQEAAGCTVFGCRRARRSSVSA